jgi:soluble lytic murein transglycosylase-like protein
VSAAGVILLFDTAAVQSQITVFLGKLDSMLSLEKDAAVDHLRIWKNKDYAAINQRIEALETDFPKDLIKAIAWCESEWNHIDTDGHLFVTVNRKKSGSEIRHHQISLDYGIMQINERMESLSRKAWDWERIKNDPEYNLRAGVAVLKSKIAYIHRLKRQSNWRQLESRYCLQGHDELDLMLKAYNGFQPSWNYPKRIKSVMQEKPWEKAVLRQLFFEANWPDTIFVKINPARETIIPRVTSANLAPEISFYTLEIAQAGQP